MNAMDHEDKQNKTEEERKKYAQDIIDKDLYEEFSDEELVELVEEARVAALLRARQRKENNERPKSPFPKWVFWLIAFALFINVAALLPQTLSIPAIDFLITSAKLSAKDDVKEYKESVVVIETEDGRGTGFITDDAGLILTNYHVVEGYDGVTVGTQNDGLFTGKVVETYPEIDIAVIDIGNSDLPTLELADTYDLKSGEEMYFIGNPLKFQWIANQGTVIDYVGVNSKELPVVMMNAPVYRGNSGSPVINQSGQVIGVVFATMKHDEEGSVGLFIPINYFYEFREK